jgi:hypothetical protein
MRYSEIELNAKRGSQRYILWSLLGDVLVAGLLIALPWRLGYFVPWLLVTNVGICFVQTSLLFFAMFVIAPFRMYTTVPMPANSQLRKLALLSDSLFLSAAYVFTLSSTVLRVILGLLALALSLIYPEQTDLYASMSVATLLLALVDYWRGVCFYTKTVQIPVNKALHKGGTRAEYARSRSESLRASLKEKLTV